MFIKYNTKSYNFPVLKEPFICLAALEELELDPTSGWKCAFLASNFMAHKAGFLVVFNTEPKEKEAFYVEKHAVGKGRKASKFKKVMKEDEDRVLPVSDEDDVDDKVVCYLDDATRITANSCCFKIQRLEKVKDGTAWKTYYFYSELSHALQAYMKHFIRKNRSTKDRPTVQDLYDLVVDIYKRIEVAVAKR
jgi:hypothetical protein